MKVDYRSRAAAMAAERASGASLRAIGKHFGVSPWRASQILQVHKRDQEALGAGADIDIRKMPDETSAVVLFTRLLAMRVERSRDGACTRLYNCLANMLELDTPSWCFPGDPSMEEQIEAKGITLGHLRKMRDRELLEYPNFAGRSLAVFRELIPAPPRPLDELQAEVAKAELAVEKAKAALKAAQAAEVQRRRVLEQRETELLKSLRRKRP